MNRVKNKHFPCQYSVALHGTHLLASFAYFGVAFEWGFHRGSGFCSTMFWFYWILFPSLWRVIFTHWKNTKKV